MQHKELLLMMSSLCVLSCFAHLNCLPPTKLDTWPPPAVLPYQQMVAGHPRGNTTGSTPTPLSLMPPTDQLETTELQKECE